MNLSSNKRVQEAKSFIHDLISQWKVPAKGNYVSYKEIINYSIGGMGKDMIRLLADYLGLGIGNTLFGSVIGIRPTHIQTMNIIVLIMDIFFVALRAKIMDNTNTRWGRFRPYIALVPVPLFLICSVFVFLPFDMMTYTRKMILVFSFGAAVAFVRPYFDGAVSYLGNVITPNTKERTKVLTIFSLLYSLAPTIYSIVINVLADITGGYTDIRTYRYIIVPIAGIGVFLSMFAAFGCKERYIKPKGYVPRSNLFQSTREIFKNKYWWLRTLSTWLAFMEWAVGNMFLWSFVYGSQDMSSYAVYNFILGESATIAMLMTPFLLNKWGNRKLIVVQNSLNIVFLGLIALTFKMPLIFFVFWFLNSLVNYFSVVYKPVFTAEVNDYQQYISGKRLDSAMSFADKIGLPITMLTGYFVPMLFESLGITTDYDILYEPMVRNNIFMVLCVCSMIGAAMNLFPLCFYDYSKEKHQMVVRILRFRVMLSDNMSGQMSDQTLKDGMEAYHQYLDIKSADMPDIKCLKENLRHAKRDSDKSKRHDAVKEAKRKLNEAIKLKSSKKECVLFDNELKKFDSEEAKMRIAFESLLIDCPVDKMDNLTNTAEFNTLMSSYADSKKAKKYIRSFLKKYRMMNRKIKKHYPEGIVVPDRKEVEKAEQMPHSTKEEIAVRYKAIRTASLKVKKYESVMRFYLESQAYVNEYQSRIHLDMLEKKYQSLISEEAVIQAE